MTSRGFKPPAEVRWLLGFSILSFFATVPHAFEDFAAGEMTRFGLHVSVLQYGLGVALLVALQAAAIAASTRMVRAGYLLSIGLAAFWFAGAGILHLPDVLSGPFRTGLPSAALVAGTMATNLAVGIASALAIARSYRADQPARIGRERWTVADNDGDSGLRLTGDSTHTTPIRSRS